MTFKLLYTSQKEKLEFSKIILKKYFEMLVNLKKRDYKNKFITNNFSKLFSFFFFLQNNQFD